MVFAVAHSLRKEERFRAGKRCLAHRLEHDAEVKVVAEGNSTPPLLPL